VEGKTTLNRVAAALDNFELSAKAIKTEYNLLRGFLSRSKLLRRANIDRMIRTTPFTNLSAHTITLANLLAVDVKPIDRLTEKLTAAKILLAHYRRQAVS
jgi:hypothetical protein